MLSLVQGKVENTMLKFCRVGGIVLSYRVENLAKNTLISLGVISGMLLGLTLFMKLTGYKMPSTTYVMGAYIPVYGYQLIEPIQNFLLSSKVMFASLIISVACVFGIYELNKF